MGKDSLVSYLCTGGRSTSVCVCKYIHIHTVVFAEFYTRLSLNTYQINTKVQDQIIASACLPSRLCQFHF